MLCKPKLKNSTLQSFTQKGDGEEEEVTEKGGEMK